MYSIPCRTSQYSPGRRIGCIHPFLHISLVQFILLFVCTSIMLVHNSQRDKELINSVPQTSATTFAFSFVCFFFYAPDTQGICTYSRRCFHLFTCSTTHHAQSKQVVKKITPPPPPPPVFVADFLQSAGLGLYSMPGIAHWAGQVTKSAWCLGETQV